MRLFPLVLLVAAVLSAPALACSCGGPDSALDAIRTPAIVFRGTAVAEDAIQPAQRSDCHGGFGPECAATPTVRFKVEAMYKGPPGLDEVRVTASRQDGVNCGINFKIGTSVMVAASGSAERGYHSSMCMMVFADDERAFATYRHQTDQLRGLLTERPADAGRRRALAEHYAQYADWENLSGLLAKETSPALMVLLGQAELGRGNGEAALAVFERAITADPALTEAQKGRTAALVQLERSDGFGPGSDFSGITVRKLVLSGLTVTGSSFAGGSFHQLLLDKADVGGSNFRRARLWQLSAEGAMLRGADFRHAWVEGNLTNADVREATFRWAEVRQARFNGADLTGADFTVAKLSDVDFTGARLTGVVFAGASLQGVKLPGADLSGQSLAGAMLQGVDLSGARLAGTDLRQANLSTHYAVTRLHGADLSSALLEGAKLAGAQYDCRTRWPAGVDPQMRGAVYDAAGCPDTPRPPPAGLLHHHAGPIRTNVHQPVESRELVLKDTDLSGQTLAGADLRRTFFDGGSLRGASLAGAWLDDSTFSGTDLTGADFTGVDLSRVNFRTRMSAPNLVLRKTVLGRDLIRTLGIDLATADLTGAAIAMDPKDWTLPFNPLERGAFFLKVPQAAARFGLPDLRGADLKDRNLFQADFSGVDLSGADLRGARLEQAIFSDAILTGAKLLGAGNSDSTKWPKGFVPAAVGMVYVQGQNSDSSLWAQSSGGPARHQPRSKGSVLVPDVTGATLDGINWRAAWLEGGRLAGASLRRARLEWANLSFADLRKANLEYASLNDSTLDGADLTGTNLRNTDLRWTSLRGAKLAEADLTGALYDDNTVWPDGFDPKARGARHD